MNTSAVAEQHFFGHDSGAPRWPVLTQELRQPLSETQRRKHSLSRKHKMFHKAATQCRALVLPWMPLKMTLCIFVSSKITVFWMFHWLRTGKVASLPWTQRAWLGPRWMIQLWSSARRPPLARDFCFAALIYTPTPQGKRVSYHWFQRLRLTISFRKLVSSQCIGFVVLGLGLISLSVAR